MTQDETAIKSHIEGLNNVQMMLACVPHLKMRRQQLEQFLNTKGIDQTQVEASKQEAFRLATLETEIRKRVYHQG